MTQQANLYRSFRRSAMIGLIAIALIIVLAACSTPSAPTEAPVAELPTQAVAAATAPTQAPAPTEAPTATEAPTQAPAPTAALTATTAPTQAPAPTAAPTATTAPTQAPAPTAAPTATTAPTQAPAPTAAPTQAPAPSAAITFAKDVKPIFDQRCLNCHGGKDGIKGGLSLKSYDDLMKGGDDGAVILPGDPANSLLVQLIVEGKMPKRASKLPQAEMDVIAAWVAAGAQNN